MALDDFYTSGILDDLEAGTASSVSQRSSMATIAYIASNGSLYKLSGRLGQSVPRVLQLQSLSLP